MGTKKITGDLDITGKYKIQGIDRPNGSTITQVGVTQLSSVAFVGRALIFNVTTELENRIKNAKIIILTMNNSFILTSFRADSNKAFGCGSFAYNDQGDTGMFTLRLIFETNSQNERVLNAILSSPNVSFNFTNNPYGALILIE